MAPVGDPIGGGPKGKIWEKVDAVPDHAEYIGHYPLTDVRLK